MDCSKVQPVMKQKFATAVTIPENVKPSRRFFSALAIWIGKPNVVNKRVGGTIEEGRFSVRIQCFKDLEDNARNLQKCLSLRNFHSENSKLVEEMLPMCGPEPGRSVEVVCRRFIPRGSVYAQVLEYLFIDHVGSACLFIPVESPGDSELRTDINTMHPYAFKLSKNGKLVLMLCSGQNQGYEFISGKLFSKMVNWISTGAPMMSDVDLVAVPSSLLLVDVVDYYLNYERLKKTYAPALKKVFIGSNAQKDIHEEIGIAAYLVSFWNKRFPGKKPSFVDLGCGNGILPHVLYFEGYPGFGVDLRSREMWNFLENSNLYLKEEVVTPRSSYPNVDWVIGNHSDELTPWISVIAFNSSPETNFFVLPCCPFDFNGKFSRGTNPSHFGECDSWTNSVYSSYKHYLCEIGKECGFDVLTDRLRIPSTKRDCFLGLATQGNREETKRHVVELMNLGSAATSFTPRDKAIPVRNCTKIDPAIVSLVVKTVSELLLNSCRPAVHSKSDARWGAGGTVSLIEIVNALPGDVLQTLKDQCGGLQTLIRNQHFIFKVVQGWVEFKRPTPRQKSDNVPWKTQFCWFKMNHPDGCPLEDDVCGYSH